MTAARGHHLHHPAADQLAAPLAHEEKLFRGDQLGVGHDGMIRPQREPGDPGDSFTRPTGLAMVKVTPLDALAKPHVVQNVSGYNSWPMIQAIGEKLVCVYSRGTAHSIGEDVRAVYARTSTDNGKTWTKETVVANTPHYGEVAVGKGLDSTGAMFLWVRRIGKDWNHDLCRTTDGVTFTLVATPKLAVGRSTCAASGDMIRDQAR